MGTDPQSGLIKSGGLGEITAHTLGFGASNLGIDVVGRHGQLMLPALNGGQPLALLFVTTSQRPMGVGPTRRDAGALLEGLSGLVESLVFEQRPAPFPMLLGLFGPRR